MKASKKIPKQMKEVFESIISSSDEFCKEKLNEEYTELIRKLTATLCRKRQSPLLSGKARTWAAGITHALGMVNFLFDSSQNPYVGSKELAAWFGLSQSIEMDPAKLAIDVLSGKIDSPF